MMSVTYIDVGPRKVQKDATSFFRVLQLGEISARFPAAHSDNKSFAVGVGWNLDIQIQVCYFEIHSAFNC